VMAATASPDWRPPTAPRIALVCMPWASVLRPTMAPAILKGIAQSAGFSADLYYLNIRFAEYLGLSLYENICSRSSIHSEWFFSHCLFGPSGTRELSNDWPDLLGDPDAHDLVTVLRELTGGSDTLCRSIARELAPQFIDQSLRAVNWSQYFMVGFTTTFSQSLASLCFAKNIKEAHPDVATVFGGANADGEMGMELIRAFPWIDYVVHGEAENTFPQLLRALASGQPQKPIRGISFHCGSDIVAGHRDQVEPAHLDESTVPDYSDYLDQLGRSHLHNKADVRLYFESSRGCWWGAKHHCTFCGLNGSAMHFRRKHPSKVLSDITHLAEKHQCLSLAAVDNILPPDYFTDLFPKLASMDLDLKLFYEVKANLRKDQLKTLRDAGVREIQPGIESFSSAVLAMMRKGVTAIQNIQLLKWCHELGIDPLYNILFGLPGESADNYRLLPTLFRALSHLRPPCNLQPILFERFSPYHFASGEFGLDLAPLSAYQFIYPPDRVNLSNIAYYFRDKKASQPSGLPDYIVPAMEAWDLWNTLWKKKGAVFEYERGPGFVRIYDNRPRIGNEQSQSLRRIRLGGVASVIFLFCDQIHTFRAICDTVNRHFGGAVSELEVQDLLDQFVFQWLMFREGDSYLSLAARKARTGIHVTT
jgi:ribosomal peptide maturation radical SAM protein 1